MRIRKDNNAQVSFDFLIGITIFIMAFLFLFSAIPSMFTPFQSNSDELTITADKVASTLVENVLANSSNGTPLPCIIDYSKFQSLSSDLTNSNYKSNLGLDHTYGQYNVQIILQEYNSTTRTFSNISIPNSVDSPGNQNIGQSRRFVLVRHLDRTGIDNYPGLSAMMWVRVW